MEEKNIIVEGFKGSRKSHLLLLLFFIFSYHENYRVFYLNEVNIVSK